MQMKLDESFLYNPKCFEMLISSTGLLTGDQRKERIKTIGRKNIWLAAKCKNTCVNEEQEIVDWIILRANAVYSKFHDIHAIAALLELGEYGVICILLGLTTKKIQYNCIPKDILALLMENERSISKVFAVFSEHIDKELAISLFGCLTELGYTLESDAYNAIIAITDNQDEINDYLKRMKQSGVEFDVTTYYFLLLKTNTFKEAIAHFEKMRMLTSSESDKDLLKESYISILIRARTIEDLEHIRLDYEANVNDGYIKLYFAYYSQAIQLSRSFAEMKYYHEAFMNYFTPKINTINKKQKRIIRRYFSFIVSAITNRVKEERSHFQEILDILLWYVMISSEQPFIRISKNTMVKYYYLVLDIVKELNDFQKCKQLIECMIKNHYWIHHSSYDELLQYVQSTEEATFILGHKNLTLFKPQSIVRAIQSCDDNVADYIFHVFEDNHYPLNVIHYNVLIKKSSIEKAFQIIESMKKKNLTPDIFTIQPMLNKWETLNDLSIVIQLATSLSINADKFSALAMERHAEQNNLTTEFIDFSIELSRNNSSLYNSTWKSAIMEASNHLISKL